MRSVVRPLVSRFSALSLLLFAAACSDTGNPIQPPAQLLYTTPTGLVTANPPQPFSGAGDIGTCNSNNDEATAQLLDNIPGPVFVLGDNVYENGTTSEYTNCYGPTWGRHKARTYPSAGNHEYNSSGAAPYYAYFGAAAGDPAKGYYSFELGAWHVIVINSNISMATTSAQYKWLQADLAAHPNVCTLSYFHHPLYSSTGGSGSGGVTYSSVRPMWDVLYAGGADLVLGGHRHFYERLGPMKPNGSRDDVYGVREIIAGTGGKGGGDVSNKFPTSEVANGVTFGVLKLYLYDDSYAWKFVPVAGKTFSDSGSTACHGAPGGGPPPSGGVSASLSTVSASPATITASNGSSMSTITVTARDANGSPVSGATVVVAASGSLNTLPQPSGPTGADGTVTVTLSSKVAQPKVISAIANGVTITQTDTVTVVPDVVAGLGFTVQPSTTAPGATITPAVQVAVQDQFGNRIPDATNDVTLAIVVNPSGGTLSGTTTQTAVAGLATFNDLSIDQAGIGYKLTAAATGLDGATSLAFDVTVAPVVTISQTLLTAGQNLTNAATYTTGSISPAPNTLVTVAVMGQRSFGASPSPTVTGGGMSAWTEIASVTFDPVSAPTRRMTIYRAMSASPGSGPLTISFAGNQSNAQWIVLQWDGVETTGTNGAGAIVQTGSNSGDGGHGLSVSLAPFGNSSNAAYGVFGVRSGVAVITPGSGFTELSEQVSAEGTPSDLQAQWATFLNTIAATWSTAVNGGALGVEIKALTH